MPTPNPVLSLAEANAQLLLKLADIWRGSAEGYVRIASGAASTFAGQALRAAGGGSAGALTDDQVGIVDALGGAQAAAFAATTTALEDWRSTYVKALSEIMDPARAIASFPAMGIFRTMSTPADLGATLPTQADKPGAAA